MKIWVPGACGAALFLVACGAGGASPSSTADVNPGGGAANAAALTGCKTSSSHYPWGPSELRTWTPLSVERPANPSANPGVATGLPFQAKLVQAYGMDTEFSGRTAEFELPNGCRRRYRTSSFSTADVAVIESEISKHPLASDTATYSVDFQPDRANQADLNASKIGKYETQHFTLWYGTKSAGSSYAWVKDQKTSWPAFLEKAGTWMEAQWLWNRDLLGAPMPYAAAAEKKKINIYICGTGLPFLDHPDLEDCGASAADAGWVSAPNLSAGSTTLIHEFGHVIQFYTGGFRDKGDAGPIWETGAEWNSYVLSPTYAGSLPSYVNNLESGPLWSHARYGAFPFMAYLFENDRTHDLVWRSWTQNKRTSTGATTEDFLQAFVRLGQETGAYPNGFQSFADDIGWYGARLVAMDFANQRALLDASAASATTTWASHFYAPLEATADSGIFASSSQRPLLEFGTHIVPLTATSGRVTVTLTGGTSANQAAWRFAIVSVSGDNTASYSPLIGVEGNGSNSTAIDVPAGSKLFLAVTATPGVYETLGWQQAGTVTGTQFPYRVKIEGATPRTGSAAPCATNVAIGTWNLNYNTNGNLENGKRC